MAYRGRRTAEQTTSGSLQKDAKYDKMIKEALSNLKERCGSTRHNIARFITSNYKTEDKDEVLKDLSIALKRGVENNSLILMSGFGASARYCLGDKIEISQLKQSVSKVTETAADESRPSTSARRRACKKEDTIEHSQGNTSSSKDIRTNASKKGHQKKKRSKGDVRRKDTPKISAGVKGQARKRGVETGSKLRRGVETSSKSRRSTQELEHRDEKGDSTKNKTKTSPNKR